MIVQILKMINHIKALINNSKNHTIVPKFQKIILNKTHFIIKMKSLNFTQRFQNSIPKTRINKNLDQEDKKTKICMKNFKIITESHKTKILKKKNFLKEDKKIIRINKNQHKEKIM